MKTCRDIEMLLPLFSEGALTGEEKRAVEEHLAACEKCRTELAYLKKAGELVSELPPVEEPPWFRQKIMAQVRREAEGHKETKKWFYPLRIRIPLQILATIVIAVLAVYIYRSGEDQVKQVLPGVRPPSVEMSKKEAGPQVQKVPEIAAPAVPGAPAMTPEKALQEKGDRRESIAEKKERPSSKPQSLPPERERVNDSLAEAPPEKKSLPSFAAEEQPRGPISKNDDLSSVSGTVARKEQNAKAMVSDSKDKATDRETLGLAKKKEAYQMDAPAALPSVAASVAEGKKPMFLSLHVKNIDDAVNGIEKMLPAYEAKITSRHTPADRRVLRIVLPAKNKSIFLSRLSQWGQLSERNQLSDEKDPMVTMVLEIIPF